MADDSLNNDADLLEQFRNESTRNYAFHQIVTKYQKKVYWQIRRIVIDHDDANDVVQTKFVTVWKNLANFNEASSLYTWLYRIATNESLTWMDTRKRFAAVSIDGNESYFEDRITAQKDFDPNKIEWKLQQAIATLPDKQRVVFNLRYYDEMPYDEMSRVLDTSEGALKASYHHAVKKVEEFLKK